MIVDGHECHYDEADHRYSIDGCEVISVTQALVSAGIIDTKWFTEWARHRGSTVHKCIEFMVKGTLDLNTVDPRIQGYLDAYQKFVDETGFVCDQVERQVWSLMGQFAGTLDQIGNINGKTAIVDTKTGALLRPTGLQLTGYASGYHDETRMFVDRLIGLQLKPDGTYSMKPYLPEFEVWRACLKIAWWKRGK